MAKRARARQLTSRYNATGPHERAKRRRLLVELFAAVGDHVEIEPPFHCDYGTQILVGADVYANFGCVVLDCARVEIGDRVLLGPGVHLYAATHPVDPAVRRSGRELAAPVTIGADVWLGGGVIVCPGVTIGPGATIGAGSVVTLGHPARRRRRRQPVPHPAHPGSSHEIPGSVIPAPPVETDPVDASDGEEVMPDMMARVEAEDLETWLRSHRSQAEQRRVYGMTDGPIYRDVDDPNAAFVHIHVEDLARAGQWFQTKEFAKATSRAGVIRREFYLADKQERPATSTG